MPINYGQEKYAKAASKISYDDGTTSIKVDGAIIIDGYQALGDAAGTVSGNTSHVVFTADAGSSRVITMPTAIAGRHFKAIWIVEQASNDRVFTCVGSDDMVGQVQTSVEGNGAGDGDVVSVTDGTVALTVVDDVNIGSYIDFYCGVDGQWVVMGHLTVDAVGSVPTIA